jgi:hypothetical protein
MNFRRTKEKKSLTRSKMGQVGLNFYLWDRTLASVAPVARFINAITFAS